MRLTPIEIRHHRFNSRLRGFDRHEVEAFLESVVADFEEIVRENAQLRRDAERLGRELELYRGRERNIQDTLTTAQGVVDQLKRTAMKEAEVMITEAEVRSEKLLKQADGRRADLAREVAELRLLRGRLTRDLRHTLGSYASMVDGYESAAAASDEPDDSTPS
ncbi:MAG: DivIVA domain-containing protein [Deltaproteobacteria bacterium]|nr:DivIVA domain-containing protein [Deltaproteobacteria bacterium]MBW2416300.1 DivIVA domain-containing protein [Deltaproteobacteria bacterium]